MSGWDILAWQARFCVPCAVGEQGTGQDRDFARRCAWLRGGLAVAGTQDRRTGLGLPFTSTLPSPSLTILPHPATTSPTSAYCHYLPIIANMPALCLPHTTFSTYSTPTYPLSPPHRFRWLLPTCSGLGGQVVNSLPHPSIPPVDLISSHLLPLSPAQHIMAGHFL